jgi:hypothetical protein
MFYRAMASAFPIGLLAVSCVSKSKWPATTMAAIYMGLYLIFLWSFPLFPAQPKLGPVYQHITHMVPLWFPVLLIFPAIALDLVRSWFGENWGNWRSAMVAGFVFIAAFVIVQWPFADFLQSPAARNWVFGRIYFTYSDPANLLYNPYQFTQLDKTNGEFAKGMAIALIESIIFCWIGLALGKGLRKVKR